MNVQDMLAGMDKLLGVVQQFSPAATLLGGPEVATLVSVAAKIGQNIVEAAERGEVILETNDMAKLTQINADLDTEVAKVTALINAT